MFIFPCTQSIHLYVSIELYFYFLFDVTIKIRVKVYDMTYICCAYNNDNTLLLILYATYGQFMFFTTS